MKRGWPERWRQGGPLIWALLPLSWVYRLLWQLTGSWRSRRPAVAVAGLKVLSVGNLSVGGTGKSALVRALAQASLKRRKRTAVLLRGYGAQSGARPLWVSKGRGPLVETAASGDEAQEHARLKGLGVLIDADRLRGALAAREAGYQVLILDDGFQRRWQLKRDADLLLATGPELALGERLLPAGPWREPWDQAQGATALLLQEAPKDGVLPEAWAGLPLIKVGYQPQRLWRWSVGALRKGPPLSRLRKAKVLALSGLGQPQRFEASLQSLGAQAIPARFVDHHPFSLAELEALDLREAVAICTTMKDAQRLPQDWKPRLPVWILEVALESQPRSALAALFRRLLK
jgi:tetraacyldisaccharide 4'-kinase